jgi:hypothetical protein
VIDRQPLQPGDVPITFADVSKARAKLGYQPKVKVETGIPLFVDWFKQSVGLKIIANNPNIVRPTFSEAVTTWKALLAERKMPTELIWIFDENIVFEKDPASSSGFKLGFQTRFSPAPPEAEQIAYAHFGDFEARIVFYRIGTHDGKSVCLVLCDPWFENKGDKEGFVRRDNWLMSFRPGTHGKIEEITDEPRWKQRILRDRPLHDLDFCMSLRSVHEIFAHGRVLTAYEHYALRFLHAWRRMLTPTE